MPLMLRRRSVFDLLNINKPDSELSPQFTTSDGFSLPSPPSPRPVSDYGMVRSRLSHELRAEDVADETAPSMAESSTKRFSMLKLRNFSESHLGAKAKEEAAREAERNRPPIPTLMSDGTLPSIVRTAPTMNNGELQLETERKVRPSLFKRSTSRARESLQKQKEPQASAELGRAEKPKSSASLRWRKMQGKSTGLEDLARLSSMHTQNAPPSYGDEANSMLALPMPDPRFSESHESDGSIGSSGDLYGQTTTTTHIVSTHTTFFRLPRRNKNRNSLFPLPVRIPPPNESQARANEPAAPRASTSAFSTKSLHTLDEGNEPGAALQRRHTETSPIKQRTPRPPLPAAHSALAKGGLAFAEPGVHLGRNDSQHSRKSSPSSPLQPPMRLGMRDRASTASSFGRTSHDVDTPPLLTASARNSSSTTGRSSLGGLLTLSRFRQGSQPDSPRYGSPGTRSKSNSFAISREALVIPVREEGDTPGKYLERLEAAVARSMIAGILSKSPDPFAQAVLTSYTRRFAFFGEPIDMSLRKFLLEAELPKETQQVDRVVQAFADRYHECNPGIFMSPDQAYITAFSLMMLHTDAFNKNNKRKMQKHDYIKNTSGQQVADEVLGCFYDNICYTPFVHYEEEVDINGERVMPFKPKKSKLKGAMADTAGKKPSGPVDPYNLLIDQKLDMLRPPIRDSIAFDDPYNYRGSQGDLEPQYLQRAFTHTGILQIISARSRPSAYEGQLTSNPNPAETQAGIIDLKITKVGILWRKATKKKKARSPWQEWGAILTGSQLYLFKNAHWAKGLLHQFMAQQKPGQPRMPVIFKPPLPDFKPDALIKTDNAVALVDHTYQRHKHAFTFSRAGSHDEVLLADNESELDDWLALINYAAAFRAAGVRIRGMVGGNEEDLRRQDGPDTTHTTQSVSSATGQVSVMRGGLSPQLARQVMAARRQIMLQKIAELEQDVTEANKKLEDLMRDARHLLVLAPIAPKTRDDVLHAAARVDAMTKWLRRDIWRMKCNRDILALDVRLDGVSAQELQVITSQQTAAVTESSGKRDRAPSLPRLPSKGTAALLTRSPPQSPTSPTQSGRSERPSTTESIETFIGNDVFQTPPEASSESKHAEAYRLPPLQLNVQQRGEHRASVSSALLSVSSAGGPGSLSHASSTSSVRRLHTSGSPQVSDMPSPMDGATPTLEEREVDLLARSTSASDTVATGISSLDGTTMFATPESRHKGVRRSLQKTLRDAHHQVQVVPGSVHRHRKGRESDGTIRSPSGAATGDGLEEAVKADGTPGLQRETGRFILHGKQASVIQFGSEWPSERMKTRREKWRESVSQSPKEELTPRASNGVGSGGGGGVVEAGWSPVSTTTPFAELGRGRSPEVSRALGDGEAEEESSDTTPQSHGFREDAEAANAFATADSAERRPSPLTLSTDGIVGGGGGGGGSSDPAYFDLSPQWDPEAGKRQTVISSLSYSQTKHGHSALGSEHGAQESDEEDYSLGPREYRQTVIGPLGSGPGAMVSGGGLHSDAYRGDGTAMTEGGAEREESFFNAGDLHGEDDSMIEGPLGDEELRRISRQAQVIGTA
ncbi:hypothetical protein LTR91_007753 [Friedmanniomyces endolithicus]|uniref:SEC7 domain-containing protein n=1 Tax=Friedmanniomyces endolithicus TaxID=329885 RepID=A0AAN6KPG4_9PEZI|nr:hypothetical protein LTR57_011023 [Friedmanniomyces endolithicus]KAK0993982.1 hypothetical protein LTR91_007753 [Friedmanniomyces endolithicus]KAK1000192.1 hypothetical protein LTS01_005083 [Friedmanniomyces endolithicus]